MASWDFLTESAKLNNSIIQYLRNTGTRLTIESASESLFNASSTTADNSTTFCSADNVQTCVCLLNQELQVLGLPVIPEDINVVFILNCLHDVIHLYQRSMRERDNLTDSLHKAIGERDHFQVKTKRLREETENLDRNIGKEEEKNRQLTVQIKTVNQRFKKEKEEVKKLHSFIQREAQQSSHRMKKLERQIVKLSDRLHEQMSDKNPIRKIGIGIANPIRTDGRRATWKTDQNKQELELHQHIVSKYEERQQMMCGEIAELRDCLVSMESELLSVLNRNENPFHMQSPEDIPIDVPALLDVSTSSDDADDAKSQTNCALCLDDLQHMDEHYKPVKECSHKDIEKRIKKTCSLLKQKMSQQHDVPACTPRLDTCTKQAAVKVTQLTGSTSSETDRHSGEREKLCSQIQQYKEVINQQEQLIQQSIRNQSKSAETSSLHASDHLEEREILAEEKRYFLQEKANFDEEKRKFVEVVVKLGKERQAIQEERVDLFMEQCKNLDQSLATSCDSVFSSSHQGSPHRVRMLPATPVFSTTNRIQTPSTAELYASLGISPYTSCAGSKLHRVSSAESVSNTSRSSTSHHLRSTSASSLQMDAIKRALFNSATKPTGRSDFKDNGS